MNTLSTTLKHADPLRHEPPRLANAPRLRALVVDAASAPRGATSRLRTIVVAVAAILLVGVFGMRLWPGATVTLTAEIGRAHV